MKKALVKITNLVTFLSLLAVLFGCRQQEQNTQQANNQQSTYQENYSKPEKKHKKHQENRESNNENYTYSTKKSKTSNTTKTAGIPAKVYDVLSYVRENKRAPEGYVGGRHFGNFEGHLPKKDASGKRINYQEWDVNPKQNHKNRGVQRLITGSDNKAYFTNDHYNTFTEIN